MIGGLKQYDISGAPMLLGARLQFGQSLGNAKGLSGYVEGGIIYNASSSGYLENSAFDANGDRYAYDKIESGVKFKTLLQNGGFIANYNFERRAYFQANRQDDIHTAGVEWTRYVKNAAGERRFGLSLEPSVKLTRSTALGEEYLAVYLMAGFER
jgi:hypothetical protein